MMKEKHNPDLKSYHMDKIYDKIDNVMSEVKQTNPKK